MRLLRKHRSLGYPQRLRPQPLRPQHLRPLHPGPGRHRPKGRVPERHAHPNWHPGPFPQATKHCRKETRPQRQRLPALRRLQRRRAPPRLRQENPLRPSGRAGCFQTGLPPGSIGAGTLSSGSVMQTTGRRAPARRPSRRALASRRRAFPSKKEIPVRASLRALGMRSAS